MFSLPSAVGNANDNETEIFYETSSRGNPMLVLNHNRYVRNRESTKRVFWRCTKYYKNDVKCPGSVAVAKDDYGGFFHINTTRAHNTICDDGRKVDELCSNIQKRNLLKPLFAKHMY